MAGLGWKAIERTPGQSSRHPHKLDFGLDSPDPVSWLMCLDESEWEAMSITFASPLAQALEARQAKNTFTLATTAKLVMLPAGPAKPLLHVAA